MIELEKLYEAAGNHLGKPLQDWEGFAADFEGIFNSTMVLFRSGGETEGIYMRSPDELIAGTNPELFAEYFKVDVSKFSGILKDPTNPFEPARRTDNMGDDEFRSLDIVQGFGASNGIFYLMLVFAVLPDKSSLVMIVTRDETADDFSDMEKQRIALFMRYLATFIRRGEYGPVHAPDDELTAFGQRYALTKTETEILSELLQGQSLRAISENSGRTYRTVRWHVQNLLDKCQVKSQKNLLSEFYRLIKT